MFGNINFTFLLVYILLIIGLFQFQVEGKAKAKAKAKSKHICGIKLNMANLTTDLNWMNQALKRTNEERLKHQVAPLTLNDELNRISQHWANELANKYHKMVHTQNTKEGRGTTCGENVYFVSSPKKVVRDGSIPVKQWYVEVKNYNFNSGKSHNGRAVGHFTQVVWKKTREVGIAYAKHKNGKTFVVATYSPRGNIVGYYTKNVFRESAAQLSNSKSLKPNPPKTTKNTSKPKATEKPNPKVIKKTSKPKRTPKTTKNPSKSKSTEKPKPKVNKKTSKPKEASKTTKKASNSKKPKEIPT